MTVVYIDLLFLLNFTANYLLLLAAGRMCGRVLRRWLLALSAALGAGYACALFFPGFTWLASPLCRVAAGVLMPVIAFGAQNALLRTTLCFFGASAALGGLVWAAELLGGHSLYLERGVLYSYLDLRLLLLLLALCYGLLSFLSDRAFRHRAAELVPLTIRLGDAAVTLTALLDTGNTLTDPVDNSPVVVAEGSCCGALLPMELPLDRPVEALALLGGRGIKGWRLLPYRAVGVDCGLLLAVRADCIMAGKQNCGSLLVALSPTPVSDGGVYRALIGGSAICGGSGLKG